MLPFVMHDAERVLFACVFEVSFTVNLNEQTQKKRRNDTCNDECIFIVPQYWYTLYQRPSITTRGRGPGLIVLTLEADSNPRVQSPKMNFTRVI